MTSPEVNPAARWWRILALALGALLLFWLPIEDLNASWVTLFAVAICGLAAVRILMLLRLESGGNRWLLYPLTGMFAGAAITLVTLCLMAFKSGLHGHGTPDFTPVQVTSVLRLTPLWTVAGFLIGLGTGILHRDRPR